MNFVTINIAYISDNQDAVNKLVADLNSSNINFNLIDAADFVDEEDFKSTLTTSEDPCFLMISDNFLKSVACLQNGLAYLQALIKSEQVIPIILNGDYIDAHGEKYLIPTEFEKVSNVIKYMNFWQENYLDLRKLKRSIPVNEEEEFLRKLKVVRSISSEVGEYLRTLRETDSYTIEDFSANHYEIFFRYFGDESAYLKFVGEQEETNTPSIITDEESISEIEGNPDEKVVEMEEKPAFLPIEDLLNGKDNLTNIVDINANSKSDNELQNGLDELMEQGEPKPSEEGIPTIETADLPLTDSTEIIEDSNKLIDMDPEWLLANAEEGSDDSQEEELEEISLEEQAKKDNRPLTDTELLAQELAEKIPNTTLEEETEELEDPAEEMISLDDLMGADLLSATNISNETSTTTNIINEEDIDENEEEEDELEGYFMDEGEESEDIEDELSEIEVLESANTLVQSGKIEEGISLLEETLVDAPEFVSVRYQYAAFLAKYQNNFQAASNQLAILLEEEPNNQSAMFFLGELAEAERDYLTAKSYYEKVYTENDEFPNVAYKLGRLLMNYLQEPSDNIIEYFEKAYQQNPTNINALYQLGLLKSENELQEEQAIAALLEVLEKAPEHPFANYDLALIYHKKDDQPTALKYYEKAAEVNPELRTTVNDQAFAIEMATKIAQSEEELINNSNTINDNIETNSIIAELDNTSEENMVEEIVELEEEGNAIENFKTLELTEKVYEIADKIALITGATSGIGKAIAIKLAKEGYSLILTGRRFSRLFQLKEQFEKEYQSAVRLLPFDIQQATSVQTALAELEEEWQDVDILINNAGLAKGETAIHEGDLEHWETMIDTNIKGLLYVTREIAPFMVKRKEGQIINICSLAGKEVYPNNGVYCATKHAVDALTKAMRIDLHKYNIRVSQVSPGFVEDTEFAAVKTGDARGVTDFVPVNASDVAEVINFMISQPPHVTLQEVVLTGTQQASANIIDRSGRGA